MLNLLWVLGAVIDILRGANNDDFDDCNYIVTICSYSVHVCLLHYR